MSDTNLEQMNAKAEAEYEQAYQVAVSTDTLTILAVPPLQSLEIIKSRPREDGTPYVFMGKLVALHGSSTKSGETEFYKRCTEDEALYVLHEGYEIQKAEIERENQHLKGQ